MAPINDAIEEIESHGSAGGWSYRKIAKKYGVARESLRRLHQGKSVPMEEQKLQRRKLTPQQELELVKYIEDLTAHRLPPTRKMIQNFASSIAKEPVSESWVTRFLNRNQSTITPHWATGMDRVRHQADSGDK
ncbi:hypothetical protein DM02DRAFT_478741, partial [Periconia macrospinosa]